MFLNLKRICAWFVTCVIHPRQFVVKNLLREGLCDFEAIAKVQTMRIRRLAWDCAANYLHACQSIHLRMKSTGQALVEFTLIFILLIIVAWIPADFGLAFYTGQITQNAVREGARIAAADISLGPVDTFCTPLSACFGAGNIFNETAVRLPAALLGPSTKVSVKYPADGSVGCNQLVEVKATGKYPFFFYHVLRFVGINVAIPDIERSTKMRWEHQPACPIS
jgi:hypothetical protein